MYNRGICKIPKHFIARLKYPGKVYIIHISKTFYEIPNQSWAIYYV